MPVNVPPSQVQMQNPDYSGLLPALSALMPLIASMQGQQDQNIDQLHGQVAQAQQGAQQAGQQYTQAAQAPQEQGSPNFIDQLLGNTGSVLSGNQDYERQAFQRGQQQQEDLRKSRVDNLSALKANYEQAASNAERLGNTELTAQYRAKVDGLAKTLMQLVTPGMQGVNATTQNANKQGGAMELQGLKGDQARSLEELRQTGRIALQKAKPQAGASTSGEQAAFDNEVYVTGTGRQFLDLTNYSDNLKNKAVMYAGALGIPALSKDQRATLDDLEATRDNLDAIMASVFDKLAKNPAERPGVAARNRLAQITQSDPDLASFNTYWSNTVRAMRATAGSRGLRINKSEIERALRWDTISLSDTQPVAQQKVANIKRLLENAEAPLLDKDWRSNPQTRPDFNSVPAKGTIDIVTPDGRQIPIDVKDWPRAYKNGAARVYPE